MDKILQIIFYWIVEASCWKKLPAIEQTKNWKEFVRINLTITNKGKNKKGYADFCQMKLYSLFEYLSKTLLKWKNHFYSSKNYDILSNVFPIVLTRIWYI